MCVFNHYRSFNPLFWSIALALLAACGDPNGIRPLVDSRELSMFVILDPDQPRSQVLVQRAMIGELPDLSAVIANMDGTQLATAQLGQRTTVEYEACVARYGEIIGGGRCADVAISIRAGAAYRVRVSATNYDSATAMTTVPEDFSILSHTMQGAPPGTITLTGTWNRSAGAHRYVVAVRGTSTLIQRCDPDSQCTDRWYVATTDTTLTATIDARFFRAAAGPFFLDVYAMNKDVYGYLMTGNTDTTFPYPPAQNVVGGHGSLGAWVRRSVQLTP